LSPNRPATEYGYVRPGRLITSGVFDVEKFVEKPTSEVAARHIEEGFLWNSGNFVFPAAVLLDEYRRFELASSTAVSDAVDKAKLDIGFIVLDPDAFELAEAKSIDYAVMERTDRAAVMPVSYTWSDVGTWQAAWEMSERDTAKNAARGSAVFVDSRGCYVSTERQLVALLGLEDVAVIATDDALLVAQRERSQELKRVVQEVKDAAPKLIQDHLTVHRPWGSYRPVDAGARYQVKRIVVKKGGRLSLQLHHHRAEHWIVVRGSARVTIGDTVKMLHENESIYVPIGACHRLENPGRIDLELIEVQTGSYLGEDDIVRIEDDYHRCQSLW
jgi:mannose-1-phosphate guanylyltransferase / mannose-6-phosphate isomerase